MALLNIFGAEHGITSGAVVPQEFDNGSAQCNISEANVRTGAYSLLLDYHATSANCQGDLPFAGRVAVTDEKRYIGFSIYIVDPGDGFLDVLDMLYWSPGGVGILMERQVDGKYALFIRSTTGGALGGWSGLLANTRYRLDLYWWDNDGSQTAELLVDGVSRMSSSVAALYAGATPTAIHWGESVGKDISERYQLYIDDVWINDGSGSLYNSWAPDPLPKILAALPDADGEHAEFKDDGANAGSYDEWDDLPNDADATYNESTGAAGLKRQLSNVQSLADIGLASVDIIKAVVTKAVARVESGTTGQPAVLVRDDGTDYNTDMTPTAFWLDGTWDRVDAVQPNGAGAWTQGRFNAFQIGMQRATGDRNLRCTAVCAMVAYEEGVARRRFGLAV